MSEAELRKLEELQALKKAKKEKKDKKVLEKQEIKMQDSQNKFDSLPPVMAKRQGAFEMIPDFLK
jgi:hypothetical protein